MCLGAPRVRPACAARRSRRPEGAPRGWIPDCTWLAAADPRRAPSQGGTREVRKARAKSISHAPRRHAAHDGWLHGSGEARRWKELSHVSPSSARRGPESSGEPAFSFGCRGDRVRSGRPGAVDAAGEGGARKFLRVTHRNSWSSWFSHLACSAAGVPVAQPGQGRLGPATGSVHRPGPGRTGGDRCRGWGPYRPGPLIGRSLPGDSSRLRVGRVEVSGRRWCPAAAPRRSDQSPGSCRPCS